MIAMEPTPPDVLAGCLTQLLLRPACPTQLLRVSRYTGHVIQRNGPWETFDIHHGLLYGHPRQNQPPGFVHVVVEGGDLAHAYPFSLPTAGSTVPLTDALLKGRQTQPVLLGRPSWGGRSGFLVLMPSYQTAPTIHSDHLMYAWFQGGVELAVSLHSWIPVSETAKTLQAIVESIPQGST